MEPAPSPVVSPIVLPSPDVAVSYVERLGEINDRALLAEKKWSEAATKAKQLKAKLEEVQQELRDTIREMTHPSTPGLFDAAAAIEEMNETTLRIINEEPF
jgi:hypothetical protein